MNHYHWTKAVIRYALRIEKHRHRGKFTDAIPNLRAFLEKEPFIHDDGEQVFVDADAVIRTIEDHPEPTHKEITGIVTQAVVNRMRENEDSRNNEEVITVEPEDTPTNEEYLVPMKEPASRDEWFLVIKITVDAYQEEHKRTPKEWQLWAALKENPPKDWDIEYHAKGDMLISQCINKELPHRAFKDRYSRYYPKK